MLDYIIRFLNKGGARSVAAKKNIAASLFIKGCSVLVNFALVPLTISYVNSTRYGIWLTLSSVIAWFSLFDIGFGSGLRNRFSEARAEGDLVKARTYVSTTYAVLMMIFAFVWILFSIGNSFIDWPSLLQTPAEMADELTSLALIVFSFFCMQIVLKTISTIIIADQKPSVAALFDMLAQLISLVLIYILTKTTEGSLISLGIAAGSAQIIILLLASLWLFSGRYRSVAPSPKYVRFGLVKNITSLGFSFFFIQVSFVLMYETNNIIISNTSSPAEVTVFNLAYKYLGFVLMIFLIILSPVWSAFTDAYTKSDFSWMRSSVSKLRIASYLSIIPVAILVVFSGVFYKFWVGNSVTVPLKVTVFVAIYIVILCLLSLNTHVLNGVGKIRLQLVTYLSAIVFHVPIAFILGRKFGVIGVVASASFFFLIIAIFATRQVNLILNNKAKGIWNR